MSPDPLFEVLEFGVMDLGSSTELITLKPWSTGKQLPLGFSVLGHFRIILKYKSFKQQASSLTMSLG